MTRKKINPTEIKLTDDTVENIRLMAPYLDEPEQKNVFYLMVGLLGGEIPEKKEGDKGEQ